MPNEHGQITKKDFCAPKGGYRITREYMSDGGIEIVSDYTYKYRSLAVSALKFLRTERKTDIFLLWNDKGEEIELLPSEE